MDNIGQMFEDAKIKRRKKQHAMQIAAYVALVCVAIVLGFSLINVISSFYR